MYSGDRLSQILEIVKRLDEFIRFELASAGRAGPPIRLSPFESEREVREDLARIEALLTAANQTIHQQSLRIAELEAKLKE